MPFSHILLIKLHQVSELSVTCWVGWVFDVVGVARAHLPLWVSYLPNVSAGWGHPHFFWFSCCLTSFHLSPVSKFCQSFLSNDWPRAVRRGGRMLRNFGSGSGWRHKSLFLVIWYFSETFENWTKLKGDHFAEECWLRQSADDTNLSSFNISHN